MLVINTEKIIKYTQETIRGSKSRLVIVSPYLDINSHLIEAIDRKCDENVKVIIVCGKTALTKQEKDKIYNLNNIEVRFLHNLHAKFILNEEYGIISSMNMYEASELNTEIGVLISRRYDTKAFSDMEQEFYTILKKSQVYREDIYKNR